MAGSEAIGSDRDKGHQLCGEALQAEGMARVLDLGRCSGPQAAEWTPVRRDEGPQVGAKVCSLGEQLSGLTITECPQFRPGWQRALLHMECPHRQGASVGTVGLGELTRQ